MQRIIFPRNIEIKKSDSKEKIWLLPEKGNLYKTNLHTHSTVSDGSFTPEQLKALYMEKGYHAVAYTDHKKCVPHTELTDENFVALTGIEVDFSLIHENGYAYQIVHINALAREPETAFETTGNPLDYDLINREIQKLKEKNCIVTVNHPVFSVMSCEDLLRIKGMDNVEVYNSVGVKFNNYSDDSAFYEYFLREGGKAGPIAADDSHMKFEDGTPFVEYFQGFTVVKAPELTYDALIEGLDRGAYYASTGPMFESMWLEGDMLHVKCSPVSGVYVHGKYWQFKSAEFEQTDSLTEVTLDISGLRAISPYIWVQLCDTKGQKAWARPYWF